MLKSGHSNQQSRGADLEIGSPGLNMGQTIHKEGIEQIQGAGIIQLETLYVERRYCTVCNFEQPLRSKHCKDCNKCVGQYDHHCPWIGKQFSIRIKSYDPFRNLYWREKPSIFLFFYNFPVY